MPLKSIFPNLFAKIMKFTHLHVHSHYSLLDGLPKINELLNRCQELGMESIALTDHGALYGAIEFYKKAKASGIKPIIGCEMYVAPEGMHNKRPKIDDKRFHLVVLAKNKQGYQNLIQLVTNAWLEGFYYKPRIDKELLKKHAEGLIGLSACLAGEIPRAVLTSDGLQKAEKLALEYQEIFGSGNFYLEIEHHPGLAEQEIVNQTLIKISKKYSIPLVATHDVHYLNPEDAEAQDILMAVNTGAKSDDPERLTMKTDNFSLQPPEQMMEWFKNTPEAISNTQVISDACNLEIQLGKIQLPHFEVPDNQTADEYLKKLCYQGLNKRYGTNFGQKILDRLEYELEIIKNTGFASYFLIVQDFVNWAKFNGIIVGPGRGSAAGSLVSYLLNITDIDPLKYNLLFERFLNPERVSMPDIDLDFADTRRDEVIEYVRQKYGQNRVAQIITFGTMAARAAIRDVGRAMDYAYNLCDQVAKTVPFGLPLGRALHESMELHQLYDSDETIKKLIDTAMKLEGVARHASTHACGVVITKDDLNKIIPLQRPTQDNQIIVTQYEMHAIEDLGLLKMDFLGLKNLTIIENAINIVKRTKNIEIDLAKIPLDDKKTFDLFREAKTTGVFQLESDGMKHYLKELKPTEFEDIIAMVALYRPGPIELIPDFIARKNGRKEIEYLHQSLKPILKNTYGVCVYQEQLLQIVRSLAGFSLAEADILRKAVGKKIKKLLDEQEEKFMNGTLANGIDKIVAEKIWEFIKPFANYAFNRSHATCYAMIGYQTAFLKAHFPTEFMAALMSSEQNDVERIAFLINECQSIKIKILPPDINHSLANFTVTDDHEIRFGLSAIKNVGNNIVAAIVQERKNNGPFLSISNFVERVQNKDLNKKSLEALIKCGAMDSLGERNQLLYNLENILNYSREIQKSKKNGQTSLFDLGGTLLVSAKIKFNETEKATEREKLGWEKELLGLYISEHPAKKYQACLEKLAIPCAKLTALTSDNNKQTYSSGQQVKVGGVISKIQKIITRNGKPMLFIQLEDTTGRIEILVFPNTLEKTATLWQEDKIVIINGTVTDRDGTIKILCNEAREIE